MNKRAHGEERGGSMNQDCPHASQIWKTLLLMHTEVQAPTCSCTITDRTVVVVIDDDNLQVVKCVLPELRGVTRPEDGGESRVGMLMPLFIPDQKKL